MKKLIKRNYIFNTIPSPKDERDYSFSSTITNLPLQFSLSDYNIGVKDQNGYPVCTAMAVATLKEYQERINSRLYEFFDHWAIYDEKTTQYGMYIREALKIIQKNGAVPLNAFRLKLPYAVLQSNYMSNFRIQEYYRIFNIEDIKKNLCLKRPCVIGLPVYNLSKTFWRPEYDIQPQVGGHTVLIIGYDDYSKHFLIQNSWGKKWGNRGFGYLPYDDYNWLWEIWGAKDAPSKILKRPILYTFDKWGIFWWRVRKILKKISPFHS